LTFRWSEPGSRDLDALLDRVRGSSPTYPETGATQTAALPAGYAHDRHRVELGTGAFERATDGLRSWQAHSGAGVAVYPHAAPLEAGVDVVVVARVGLVHAMAPCRVVYVVDERDRFGFAYGTLPGHPERGEEAFVVERAADRVTFSIVAFSRPVSLAARAGRPVARAVQRRVTCAYLDALHRYASTPD
jgi:uncharacterized protein (UPF0548 family)